MNSVVQIEQVKHLLGWPCTGGQDLVEVPTPVSRQTRLKTILTQFLWQVVKTIYCVSVQHCHSSINK